MENLTVIDSTGRHFMKSMPRIFEFASACHHRRMSRVFTTHKRTYRVCRGCGREFDCSRAGHTGGGHTPFKVAGFAGEPMNEPIAA